MSQNNENSKETVDKDEGVQSAGTASHQSHHYQAAVSVCDCAVEDGKVEGEGEEAEGNQELEEDARAGSGNKPETLPAVEDKFSDPADSKICSSPDCAAAENSSADGSNAVKDNASNELATASDVKEIADFEFENATDKSSQPGTEADRTERATAIEVGAEAMPSSSSDNQSRDSQKPPLQSVYHVKWIKFKGSTVPIITQNENGPCPLLAIMNILLLKCKIKLPVMVEMVTSGQLMEYLGDCIFENAPKDISEGAQLNYEQNMHDAMAVFHKLQTGLDVNVKFTGVGNFEYTSECIVFDLLAIPLYHGWLVDPEDPAESAAVGNCSYNQLVEKVITQKNSNREELVTEALVAEEFLSKTASQLTYHGLSELASTVKTDEMCVFFRNNHFSTIYKHKDELFLLVTDQGFLTESNAVWESLCNVEGDGHFVDAEFHTYRKPEPSTLPIPASRVPTGSDEQIDQDYLVALSLQQEQQLEQPQLSQGWAPTHTSMSDHELALQLQEEEKRVAAAEAEQRHRKQQQQQQQQQLRPPQQQQPPSPDESREREKSSDCHIL